MKKIFLNCSFLNKKFFLFILFLVINNIFIVKVFSKGQKTINKSIPKKVELISNLRWELYKGKDNDSPITWQDIKQKEIEILEKKYQYSSKIIKINSLNRSIVFNNNIIGPDISWIIPPGFSWNSKYKFDLHVRGHNTQIPDPPNRKFFGWNDGDAVGLVSYQFLHLKNSLLNFHSFPDLQYHKPLLQLVYRKYFEVKN